MMYLNSHKLTQIILKKVNEMSVFADRLRKLRNDAGLSQETAAAEIGVSRETYSRYESGTETKRGQEPRIPQLNRICETFGCDAGYLCGQYEQVYRSQPDISIETGLSAKAVRFLKRNANDAFTMSIVNYLLENPALIRDIKETVFFPNGGIYANDDALMKFKLTNDVIHLTDDMKEEFRG